MDPAAAPRQNQLLSALDTDLRRHLFSCLEPVRLPLGAVLYQRGDPVRHVYFPIDAIVVSLGQTGSGALAEISVSGNDGLVGITALLGGDCAQARTVVVHGGYGYRLPARQLVDECNRQDALMGVLLRYVQSRMVQMTLTAACNRHHSTEQQLCRWLLLFLDRLPGSQLTMTHRLIANMLGVRREGVTAASGRLRDQGAIEYSRGHITVLDRRRLEQLSCECYAAVRNETERLLHPAAQGPRPVPLQPHPAAALRHAA